MFDIDIRIVNENDKEVYNKRSLFQKMISVIIQVKLLASNILQIYGFLHPKLLNEQAVKIFSLRLIYNKDLQQMILYNFPTSSSPALAQ